MSTIIDLYDNSIVSYVVGHSNNNKLVFDTLDIAVANNPTAKPYSIVIVDISIQVKISRQNLIRYLLRKVCLV